MIVLDTDVVSETMRPSPEPRVIDWLNRQEITTLHLTTISLAELRFGSACLDPGRRQDDLQAWLGHMLAQRYFPAMCWGSPRRLPTNMPRELPTRADPGCR